MPDEYRDVIENWLFVDWICYFGPEASIPVTLHYGSDGSEPGLSVDMSVSGRPVRGISIGWR
jgi:hypothetical protein